MKIPITREFDWKLFLLWFLLVLFGIIYIFSASTYKVDSEIIRADYWWKQICFAVISLIALFAILKIPTNILDVFVYPAYILTIGLLFIVLFMPQINNATRWIIVAGI
ncbi:MAG: FtsW/RodA/SpoVE family cell cycle protein, partial [Candidatus Cloacimonetes bacterium]|nr:FtsW/RodA/SpoVE family cell cycle protein [Candidatus Cloacimonadota bacterium]